MGRRRRHFAVERLSAEGQAVVHRGFADKWTLEHIRDALAAATDETIALSSLSRWMASERVRRRIEQASQWRSLALETIQSDPDGQMARAFGTVLEQLAFKRIGDLESELGEGTALAALDELRKQQKLELKHRQVAADERAVAAQERKADAAATRADAALLAAEAANKRAEALMQKMQEADAKLKDAADKVRKAGGTLTADAIQTIREQVFGLVSPPPAPEVAHAG